MKKSVQVQENKGAETSDFRANVKECGKQRNKGSYLRWRMAGGKKSLQVLEITEGDDESGRADSEAGGTRRPFHKGQ